MAAERERDWTKDEVPQVDPYDLLIAQVVARAGFVRCPFCRVLLDYCPFRCSCLGPSRLECPRCGRVLISHRKEWAHLSGAERWELLWITLGYLAGVCLVGFTTASATFRAWGMPFQLWENLGGLCVLGFAVAVVAVQAIRIFNSRFRSRFPDREPYRPAWYSLDFNIRWKLLLLIIVAPQLVAAWLYVLWRL
jgi:hypothetical protein